MMDLSLNEVFDIYLSNSIAKGKDIEISKKLAYQEIQNRSIRYRDANEISKHVMKLNELIKQLPSIEEKNHILFVDNFTGYEIFEITKQLETYCIESYRPELQDLLSEIENLTSRLDKIWEHDPEYLRQGSKFTGSRPLSQSQEYYKFPNVRNILFLKSKLLRYQISVSLGIENMKSILVNCNKTDVAVLPISSENWEIRRNLVLNFIISFISMTCKHSVLWILVLTNIQQKAYYLEKEILSFLIKLRINCLLNFEYLPLTILEQPKNGSFYLERLIQSLD